LLVKEPAALVGVTRHADTQLRDVVVWSCHWLQLWGDRQGRRRAV